MPGYTPSSPPIAEIPAKPKRHPLDISPRVFMALCAVIAWVGIADLVWEVL